jgi:hypothetical protein
VVVRVRLRAHFHIRTRRASWPVHTSRVSHACAACGA